MTILEYLKENEITIKAMSDKLSVDASTFGKTIRGQKPLGLILYNKIKDSELKDCTLDNLKFTTELEHVLSFNKKTENTNEDKDINVIDLSFRLNNRDSDKEPNKIINIERNLVDELDEKTNEIKRIIEENKKLFKINFRYAVQFQDALDCLDDLEIQIQMLRMIIIKNKNIQNIK